MRFVVFVAALLTSVPAAAEMMMEPPFQRMCAGPAKWSVLEKCTRTHAHGATILPQPTAKTRLVRLSPYESYLFVQSANGLWRRAMALRDKDYAVVSQRAIQVAKKPALQIELRHRIALSGPSVPGTFLTEKIALVCSNNESCRRFVYSCIVMSRGKATESFLGEVAIADDGTIAVTGDRTQTGSMCTVR